MAGLPHRGGTGFWLTEGGVETEVLYKHGFDLPEFAVFPLLDNPKATDVLRGMFRQLMDVAAARQCAVFLSGLDYRASPDWGEKLGYSPESLAAANTAAIVFLREIAGETDGQVPDVRIGGVIGPRGDAYGLNTEITEASAEDYHAAQLATLKAAGVDMAVAMTFNNSPEAIGVARAAQKLDVPLSICFTVTETGRMRSGETVREAVLATDAATQAAPDFYGINCSHPFEFAPALEPGVWFERVRLIRPNASKMEKIALCKLGHLEEGDPPELARLLGDLARRYPHVDVWGGCCGTGALHLDLIAGAVEDARAAHRPA